MFENVVGLVVEYNPFHNGHLHHINEINKLFQNNIKIAVMSGDFVQRGEPSLINKIEKTKIALSQGLDIVVELPVFYSTQSAELFARGAIGTLDKLFCNKLVFGSENNDIQKLMAIKYETDSKEFQEKIKSFLKEGLSYPNAFSNAINNLNLKSNDILGLEYLRSLDFFNSKIVPYTIKREKVGYYDGEIDNLASASYIRKTLFSFFSEDNNIEIKEELENLKKLMPIYSFEVLKENIEKILDLKKFYDIIKYKILTDFDSLKDIQDMEVGLENRIYKCCLENLSFDEFFNKVLTKRLTISRLQRILIHILLKLDKNITERVKKDIPFVKILGFSQKGQEYLNYLKKKDVYKNNKILTSNRNIKEILSDEELKLFEYNEMCSNIYQIKSSYKFISYPIIIDKEWLWKNLQQKYKFYML